MISNLAFIFMIIASASTNLIANFIPSQYSLINFLPSSLSLKSSSLIIAIFGLLIGIFWLVYLSQIGILSFIDTFGAFFGPIIWNNDFRLYFVKKESLVNKDIYSLEKWSLLLHWWLAYKRSLFFNFRFYFFSINNLEFKFNVFSILFLDYRCICICFCILFII